MVVREDQERVKTLISDTITLLCRNGLTFKSKFCINALIGITLDEDDVFLVDIRETVKTLGADIAAEEANDVHNPDCTSLVAANSPSRKHKKSRKRAYTDDSSELRPIESASELGSVHGDVETDNEKMEDNIESPAKQSIKKEERDNNSDDLVFVKDEPAEAQLPMLNTSIMYSQQPHHPPPPPQHHSDILDSLAQHGQLYGTPTTDCLSSSSQWDASSSQSAALDSTAQVGYTHFYKDCLTHS